MPVLQGSAFEKDIQYKIYRKFGTSINTTINNKRDLLYICQLSDRYNNITCHFVLLHWIYIDYHLAYTGNGLVLDYDYLTDCLFTLTKRRNLIISYYQHWTSAIYLLHTKKSSIYCRPMYHKLTVAAKNVTQQSSVSCDH